MRLDHFIAKRCQLSEARAKAEIASGAVSVDESPCYNLQRPIDRFCSVSHRGKTVQVATERLYIALHKPVGVLSATTDPAHETVIDLIEHPQKGSLHLAGRLDRSSSGLILLANDGEWSEAITSPQHHVEKVYEVETQSPIPDIAIEEFREGFHFETEGIKTRPATLVLHGPCRATVTLHEGRYHQIKRMFHRINETRLRSLHRVSIGPINLGPDLAPGGWRFLTASEVGSFQMNLTAQK